MSDDKEKPSLRERLMSLDMEVKGERIQRVVDFLRIDRSKIELDAENIADEYFFWHQLAEEAEEYYRDLNTKFTLWEAQQDRKVRNAMDREGSKMTEAAVNRQIKLQKGDRGELAGEYIWRHYNDKISAAKKAFGILRGLVEAIRIKKEMIKSFIDKGRPIVVSATEVHSDK